MTRFFPWHFPDNSLTVNNIPDISLTCFNFPDISRFSRQVVTLTYPSNKLTQPHRMFSGLHDGVNLKKPLSVPPDTAVQQTINSWVNVTLNASRKDTDMIQTHSGDAVKQATVQSSIVWTTDINTEWTPMMLVTAISPYRANTIARCLYNDNNIYQSH